MSALKRGQVDPSRSLLWNLIHYRRTDQRRTTSTLHHDMWRKIMMIHDLIFILVVFAALSIGLMAATALIQAPR